MHPSIAPIAQIFGVSIALYGQALAGLGRKTLLWTASHLPPVDMARPGSSDKTSLLTKLRIRKTESTVKKKPNKKVTLQLNGAGGPGSF